jgi:hypothetical protein
MNSKQESEIQMATYSMACATYFERRQTQLRVTNLPCHNGKEFSLIIPNASTHGPPISRAVQVNRENSMLSPMVSA